MGLNIIVETKRTEDLPPPFLYFGDQMFNVLSSILLVRLLLFPLTFLQIHTSIFFEQNALLPEKICLVKPSRGRSSGMIDYSIARIFSIVLGHSENLTDQSGIFLSADQSG